MKLVWLTDIHLNFISAKLRANFYDSIAATQCDGILLCGDIAEAPSISAILIEMSAHIGVPIYFVLGNHDYYHGQVDNVRKEMKLSTNAENFLFWLPIAGVQMLTDNTVLLGVDGWADGRYGDFQGSPVSVNDSVLIDDLFQKKVIGKYQLLQKMQELADRDAMKLHDLVLKAIKNYSPKQIIILTHVPPYQEACLYKGKITDNNFLPFFAAKATGDVLTNIAKNNENTNFLVLCGHTHAKAYYQQASNLIVKVGKAEYYTPEIQETIALV